VVSLESPREKIFSLGSSHQLVQMSWLTHYPHHLFLKFPKLFFFFETKSCYVARAGFKLVILLPQPPECWDYRQTPVADLQWAFLTAGFLSV
jgi:hypothetical protein